MFNELTFSEPNKQIYGVLACNKENADFDGEIMSFVCTHKESKTNIDVKLLCISSIHISSIKHCTMDYIPRIIKSTFPQLTRLMLVACGLKEISRKSLIGLEALTTLIVSNNIITTLPKDLLVDMHCLSVIGFPNNQLKFVDSQMLILAKNKLLHVDFRLNPTINVYYSVENPKGSVSLAELMSAIDTKCKKPNLQLSVSADFFVQGHKELWRTGVLSDFIIETSLIEFKVHKAILAAGSPVFAAMFASNMKEQQDSRMIINDFSPNDVRDFLQFFYFGSVTHSINAVEIFKLAEKYVVRDLKRFCEALLLDIVQVTNAIQILELGTLYSNDVLKNEAFRIIKIALSGKVIPNHWINEPARLREIIDTKIYLDSLFTDTNNGED